VFTLGPEQPEGAYPLAKSKPELSTYASSGRAALPHGGELFKAMPKSTSYTCRTRGRRSAHHVLAANVQMMFDAITTMARSPGGKVRAIATSGKTRFSITPDVPTLDQAAYPATTR